MQLKKDEIISAEVMLKSASGRKIGPETLITSENIAYFAPPPDAYAIASAKFKKLGFDTGPVAGLSFSLTASAARFERTFGTGFRKSEKGGVQSAAGKMQLPLDHLEDDLRNLIEMICFSEPPDFGPAEF